MGALNTAQLTKMAMFAPFRYLLLNYDEDKNKKNNDDDHSASEDLYPVDYEQKFCIYRKGQKLEPYSVPFDANRLILVRYLTRECFICLYLFIDLFSFK